MAMVNRPRDFRHHDVVRAIRAARAAGIDPSVRIRTPTGTEYFFGGEVGASKPKRVPDPGPKSGTAVRTSASLAKGGEASMGDLGVRAFPLARGGDVAMHGKGDRTVTAAENSAGTQKPGGTAHATTSRGSALAEGGSRSGMFKEQAADSAPAGRTAKAKSAAIGGEARPARPGSCGT